MADYTVGTGVSEVDGDVSPWDVVGPGDRLVVTSGTRGPLTFKNLDGASGNRITIINNGGQVQVDADGETEGIHLENCTYIHFDGTGSAEHTYGFDITNFQTHGWRATDLTEYCEVHHVEVHDSTSNNAGAGMRYVSEVGSQTVHNVYIHHCYVHDVGLTGYYLGDVAPDDSFENIEVAFCIADTVGEEGIQLKNATGVEVHHNIITTTGQSPTAASGHGILGQYVDGDWHHNIVRDTLDEGFYLANHSADTTIHHNEVVRAGDSGIRQLTSAKTYIHHNTCVDNGDHGIRVTSSATSTEIYDNLIAKSVDDHIDSSANEYNNVELDTIAEAYFTDAGNDDYHIEADSPAIGAGHDGSDCGRWPYPLYVTPTAVDGVGATARGAAVLGSISVSPTAVSGIAGIAAPSVALGSLTITPTAVGAIGGVAGPTIILGSVSVTPTAAAGVVGVATGTIVMSSLTLTPGAVAGIGASSGPGVVLGALTITPTAVGAPGQIGYPTVLVSPNIYYVHPDAAYAVGSIAQPSVVLGSLTLTPGAVAGIVASSGPGVVLGALTLTPTAASAIGAIVRRAVVLGSISLTPAAVAAVGASSGPGVLISPIYVSPAAVGAVGAVVAPTVLEYTLVRPAAAAAVGRVAGPEVTLAAVYAYVLYIMQEEAETVYI